MSQPEPQNKTVDDLDFTIQNVSIRNIRTMCSFLPFATCVFSPFKIPDLGPRSDSMLVNKPVPGAWVMRGGYAWRFRSLEFTNEITNLKTIAKNLYT